ncbi:MAG TPA: S41 family peptidase, partial [Chitinophagaceae bacterium]|nr:S41 family peptidase [Chitinophagaceae bacterium]
MRSICKYVAAATMLLLSFVVNAQTCDCQQELNFVRQHMEKNHPGFNSDIKDPNQPAYKAFVQSLEQKIAADKSGKHCIAYLKQYMFYLKDHHINIYGSSVNVREDSSAAVEAFLTSPAFTSTERIQVDSAQLKDLSGLEGIYSTPDGTYTIAVIKSPNETRDYAGVILSSKSKLWETGQVKLELKQLNDSVLQVYTYLRNHSLNYDEVRGTDLPGWQKQLPAGSTNGSEQLSRDIFTFKLLDSNTAYIAIRSFAGGYATLLDSAYKAVMPEIKKRRNLIIDVRNNGGGSDLNYKALMPFIYTDPIVGDVVDYYATPDNIKAYEQLRDLYKSKP